MIGEIIQYTGIYNHGLVTSSDATPVAIGNIEVPDFVSGWLKIDASSIVTDGSANNGGEYRVKFSKNGTLTVGTLSTVWESNDNAASISVSADVNENILIEGTGIAATEINWMVRTQIIQQDFTALAP